MQVSHPEPAERTVQDAEQHDHPRQETARQDDERSADQHVPPAVAQTPAQLPAAPHPEPARQPQRSTPAQIAAPKVTPAQLARSQQGQPSQGWLSDLLARASLDDDTTPPAPASANGHGSEPLEVISTDIAKMIDAKAAARAWDRYRSGDDDAFDTSIYAGRGEQTFQEMRDATRPTRTSR